MSIKTETGSFLIEDARRHGVEAAYILGVIRERLNQNKFEGVNIEGGYVWTCCSLQKLSQVLKCVPRSRIYKSVVSLENQGGLIKDVKNTDLKNLRYSMSWFTTEDHRTTLCNTELRANR